MTRSWGSCPVCSLNSEVFRGAGDSTHYECVRCGKFEASGLFIAAMKSERGDWRWQLSSAIRTATDAGKRLSDCITVENYEEIIARTPKPRDALDQADVLISAIAKRTLSLGAKAKPDTPNSIHPWVARAWLPDWESLAQLNEALRQSGFLSSESRLEGADGEPTFGQNFWYQLTRTGWERAIELRRTRGPGNQAFVAMWFVKAMDDVFDKAIEPAILEVGYNAYRVDRDAHNTRIDDRIQAEIRRSRILVAECTGARTSVYYEAGLAQGLGIEVIWCCHDPVAANGSGSLFDAPPPGADPWFKQLSFDTRQYTFLCWASLPQLKEMIVNRVRARDLELKRP